MELLKSNSQVLVQGNDPARRAFVSFVSEMKHWLQVAFSVRDDVPSL